MLKFKTEEAAMEYAENNIGKYDCEVVTVDGHPALLSATSLPEEARFRSPIEEALISFFKEVGFNGNNDVDAETIAIDIGAEISSNLIDAIEKYTPVKILSPHVEF